MKYLVWINGEEHDDFLKELGKHNFTWEGGNIAGDGTCIIERCFDRNYATTYYVDFYKKKLSYCVGMEIYAPSSHMRNDQKYNEYLEQCKSCEYILNKLKEKEQL